MTSLGLSSTSDIVTFDQNWHHQSSTCAGGKDLCNDAQIRVSGLMEPEICIKMLKKLSEKLSKISSHYTWLLHDKNCPSQWRFLRSLLTASKPSRRLITAVKRKGEKRQKKFKNRKAWSLKILISARVWAQMSKNAILVARRASCHVANTFSTRLKLIWPRSSLKTTKMSKKGIFGKKLQESMG